MKSKLNFLTAIACLMIIILLGGIGVGIARHMGVFDKNAPIEDELDMSPVELTDDMWVKGWIFNTNVTPDMSDPIFVQHPDGVSLMPVLEANSPLVYNSSFPSFGRFYFYEDTFSVALTRSYNTQILTYIGENSSAVFCSGGPGWYLSNSDLSEFEALTEPYVFELPFEFKYDCAYYDALKEFCIPIIAEDVEEIEFEKLIANKPVLQFKCNPYYATLFSDLRNRLESDAVILSNEEQSILYMEDSQLKYRAYGASGSISAVSWDIGSYGDFRCSVYSSYDLFLKVENGEPVGVSFSEEEVRLFNELKLYYLLTPIYSEA